MVTARSCWGALPGIRTQTVRKRRSRHCSQGAFRLRAAAATRDWCSWSARRLPGLLRAAQATWDHALGDDRTRAASLLSRALAVTGQQQIRLSKEPIASVATDRAARYAEAAGDPIAAAEAARAQAIVLRRTGSPVADQVMVFAAERLCAATGLAQAAAAGMYARILASAAYTAAGHDDRDTAAEYLAAARGAIAPWGDAPYMPKVDLDVYVVSCDRVLGDHGAALHHAGRSTSTRFPTLTRRAGTGRTSPSPPTAGAASTSPSRP